jgi:hypothetical protein
MADGCGDPICDLDACLRRAPPQKILTSEGGGVRNLRRSSSHEASGSAGNRVIKVETFAVLIDDIVDIVPA